MKIPVEYYIYKKITGSTPDAWDGPFTTLKAAQKEFDLHFRDPGKAQAFLIGEVSTKLLPLHPKVKAGE